MKKFIGVSVVIFLLLSLACLAFDAERKLEIKKVVFKTGFEDVEFLWNLEFYFNASNKKFSRAVIKNHPEVTWVAIPVLEADRELSNGKYELMLKVLDCPVDFYNGNGKKYSNRLTLLIDFTEASPEEISRIPKLLLEAAKNKKPVIIEAKLTIKGIFRWTTDGKEREEGLMNQGKIEILKVTPSHSE